MDREPMTREGYEKLKAQLDRMQTVEMPEVTKRIATARDLGDLSENAEYHAAREDQGMLKARIDALRDKLGRAYFIDRTNLPNDTVVFGAPSRCKTSTRGRRKSSTWWGRGRRITTTTGFLPPVRWARACSARNAAKSRRFKRRWASCIQGAGDFVSVRRRRARVLPLAAYATGRRAKPQAAEMRLPLQNKPTQIFLLHNLRQPPPDVIAIHDHLFVRQVRPLVANILHHSFQNGM